ncbi:uncharacterized protein PAE49_014677 [Odontesthes bonariensis]
MAKLHMSVEQGGLAIPNIRLYQLAAQLRYIADWNNNDPESVWLDLETANADSLVPVVTVQLREPATLTCVLHGDTSTGKLHWYKQSAGDTLKSVVLLWKDVDPKYGPGFSASKLKTTNNGKNNTLTILRTRNSERTSNYTVVQQPAVSDPAGPGDSVSLQCSVLSDSENKTCSGDLSVFWFRAASNKSHPHIIYTDGNRRNECDKRAATQRRCVYHFSKSISSSDAGTYYCAVATCGEILFGNGAKPETGNSERTSNYIVVQQPAVSDPAGPGDSVSLQCSVLSDSENKTCSGDLSVFWFRAASMKSHPHIIYSDGNRRNECDKRAATQKRCVYHFSKNISSSDAGTYYCAVATCGEILFGNGAKLETGDLSVFWFRAASNKSHPHIIYSDGNGRNECDKRAATQRRCVYHFSKNISSSDAGTYYCAVATCGEILFGNGTKLEIDSLVPVVTVQLGESVTLTCVLPVDTWSTEKLHWYKQSAGDTLKSIVMLWRSFNPTYGPEFSASKLKATCNEKNSTLTIFRTSKEDEGMYHCAVFGYAAVTWSGTYLSLTGNSERTSNYIVVQQPAVPDPAGPGDSVSLQCSVLSDSENKTCSGDLSVFWFRAASNKSHPHIIFSDGNGRNECDKRAATQRRCVYHFSKSISSSDAGTYYCAVATCGEILFGDGAKPEIEKTSSEFNMLVIITICFGISVIVNVFFICYKTPRAANGKYKEHKEELRLRTQMQHYQ